MPAHGRLRRSGSESRVGTMAARLAQRAVAGEHRPALAREHGQLVALCTAIERFVERMQQGEMSAETRRRQPRIQRVLRYHESAAEAALGAAPAAAVEGAAAASLRADVATADAVWRAETVALLRVAGRPAEPDSLPGIDGMLASVEGRYQALKNAWLVAGAEARLPLPAMDLRLREASGLRRALQQSVKAGHRDADIAAERSDAA